MNNLKSAIGQSIVEEYYHIKKTLGEGKFGIVKHGIHKITGKEVAIKTIKKSGMSELELQL